MIAKPNAPARAVLLAAERANRTAGHENLGFLSEEAGFMPVQPPLTALPPSHLAWDAVAAQLPDLFRTLQVRPALEALPGLSADSAALPDCYLLRAATILGIFAHAYVRSQPTLPAPVPLAVLQPWEEVTRRLGRDAPVLSYIDLIIYNWRFCDPTAPDPWRVENLRLLIPTVGNREEHVFYLTQVEMLAQATPIINAVIRLQEAVYQADRPAVEQELVAMTERWHRLTEESFLKIDPNPHSKTHVDPIVWAKTVAPFAVPIVPDRIGAVGPASPIFQLMDVLLDRQSYQTLIGESALYVRAGYPWHWRAFLAAVGQTALPQFVATRGDSGLRGLFAALVDSYAGDTGFLGVHRRKTYGYLETAFKVGRAVTIGGFAGLFKDRTWEQVDAELEATRQERYTDPKPRCSLAIPIATQHSWSHKHAVQVALDVTSAGIYYRPGDRAAILPENHPELVTRTLHALQAEGSEMIPLDQIWQAAMRARGSAQAPTAIPLRTFLRYGKIRPLTCTTAKALYGIFAIPLLQSILESHTEDQWELWDLLELLTVHGLNLRELWQAEPQRLCKIVLPEEARLYSIAAAMPNGLSTATTLLLTVAPVSYDTWMDTTCIPRRGTSSHYLAHLATSEHTSGHVPIYVVAPLRFRLPVDAHRPIIMIAGGTGIAPFRAFWQARSRQPTSGPTWLFIGTRTRDQLYYAEELAILAHEGKLRVEARFSAEDRVPRFPKSGQAPLIRYEPGPRRRIDALLWEHAADLWDVLRDPGAGKQGAVIYVCGQTGFAHTTQRALLAILAEQMPGPDVETRQHHARAYFYTLVAEGRFLQDVFTTYSSPTAATSRQLAASDVIRHNNEQDGYWMVIRDRVYDISEFIHLHPGGDAILRNYVGIDATAAYMAVDHHRRTEVDALLPLYEIGTIRELRFGNACGVVLRSTGSMQIAVESVFQRWTHFLYLVTAFENAFCQDAQVVVRQTVQEEDPATWSPLKIQLAAELHQRFLENHLAGVLGEDLADLWALATELCAPQESLGWLRDVLTTTQSTTAARCVQLAAAHLNACANAALVERGQRLGALLLTHDRQLLAALKARIADGVRVFEIYEAAALTQGGAELLASLRAIPLLMERYYTNASSMIEQVLHTK